MTERLTEKTAKDSVRRKVLVDGGTPRLERDDGAYCVFCEKKLVPSRDGESWTTDCDCPDSLDFKSTRATLLSRLLETGASMEMLDLEAQDAGLKLYKKFYVEDARIRDETLRRNDELVLSLDTLGGRENGA